MSLNAFFGELLGWGLFFGIPLGFLAILVGPAWYFRKKHGRFTLKNVFISLLISGALLVVYITAVYWGIALLAGQAAQELYKDGLL